MITETGKKHQPGCEYSHSADWRGLVYAALTDSGYVAEADDFLDCAADNPTYFVTKHIPVPETGDVKQVYCCDECGKAKVFRKTCHLRICPECAARASARFVARYMPVIHTLIHQHHRSYRFRKIVLTTPYHLLDQNSSHQLAQLKKAIPLMFDELLPSGWRKDQGFIVADEFGPNGLKLHFHILFYGQWLDNKAREDYPLSTAWQKVTGGECEVVHISAVPLDKIEHELIESLKYCAKFWKTDPETGEVIRLDPDLVPRLLAVLKGTRRVRSYGIFYNVPDPDPRPVVCPCCNRSMIKLSPVEWNIYVKTGWLPDLQELNLRLGNKSGPDPPLGNNSGPPTLPHAGTERARPRQLALIPAPKSAAGAYEPV